jgi:SAM-dependent methyltransferase
VLGVDVSAPMLVRARERAAAAGLAHVRFLAADAQTHRFAPESFDGVYSRFGVMFFADPIAAFANLRAALAPGGRLAFVCWQPLQANPWMLVPLMAVAGLVPVPPPPPPEAPGPFAFGDRDRVVHILRSAGLGDLTVEPFETELVVAGGSELDRTVEFVLEVGPTAAALREVEAATLARVRVAVRDALAPYTTPRGVVMPSAAWVVSTGA